MPTSKSLEVKISEVISNWIPDLADLAKHRQIIALYFGFQQVFDGLELFLSGHSWYDGHDLWHCEAEWEPTQNYVSLGEDSLQFDRVEVVAIYERVVLNEINTRKDIFKFLEVIVVGPVGGDYKRLK